MTLERKLEPTALALLLAVLFLFSCAGKNSLSIGRLPVSPGCVAVIPFLPKGDEGDGEKEFMSEFLASDLYKEGVTGIIYPKDIAKDFDAVGGKFPLETNRLYAADLGVALNSDYAIWGNVNYLTVVEGREGAKDMVRLISVEAFMVDTRERAVRWYFDAKKSAVGESDVKILAEISSEMTESLLGRSEKFGEDRLGSCMREASLDGLKRFLARQGSIVQPVAAAPKQGLSVESAQAAAEPFVNFSDSEKEVYDALSLGKKIILDKLGFDGRSRNISKGGIIYLTGLGKVLRALSKEGKVFRFESHVDATQDGASDTALSLARGRMVKAFLMKYFGLPDSTVEIKAYGGQLPLLPNVSKKSREKNRRIELSVVK